MRFLCSYECLKQMIKWQFVRNSAKKVIISFVCCDNIITFAIIIKKTINMNTILLIGLLSIIIRIRLQNGAGSVEVCK